MRKLIGILLSMIMILSLAACGEPEPVQVELTKDNFTDYFILEVDVVDFENKTKNSFFGEEYLGVANLEASLRLKKDVVVENVVVEGKVELMGLGWSGNPPYTFKLQADKDGEAEISKEIDTGTYNIILKNDEPKFIKHNEADASKGEFKIDDYIIVTSLSGYVYE